MDSDGVMSTFAAPAFHSADAGTHQRSRTVRNMVPILCHVCWPLPTSLRANESGPQRARHYNRIFCVKACDGKSADLAAYFRDVATKLAKVRAEAGEFDAYLLAQSVEPAGRSARCDYHIVYSYTGFPPETGNAEKTAADLKKAGLYMTVEAMYAKRDAVSYLVSTEIWQRSAIVGSGSVKGSYVRLNYYNVKPGMMADFLRRETTGWQKLAEELSQDNPGMSWSVRSLLMPGGSAMPYNAMTADGFPNWAAVGNGIRGRDVWNKVHPEQDFAAYMSGVNTIADRTRVELFRIVEVIRK